MGKESLAKKDDEIKCLKNVIKNNNSTIANLESNSSELNNIIKRKDKEVHDVEKSNQAHQNRIKTLKDDTKKYKVEKMELHKKKNKLKRMLRC